jgi:hypothetical protein
VPNFFRVADFSFYTLLIVCVGYDSLCWFVLKIGQFGHIGLAKKLQKNNPRFLGGYSVGLG